jgi:CubicO group peptidase (beta-lactamase class C family)
VQISVNRTKYVRRSAITLLAAFAIFYLHRPLTAQMPPASSAKSSKTAAGADVLTPSGGTTAHELTRADVEEFFDLLIKDQLAREDVAGAVVGVVKDGQILFSKGYGYADVEKGIPATADASLFRIGSIIHLSGFRTDFLYHP